jgi:hypothetical protein
MNMFFEFIQQMWTIIISHNHDVALNVWSKECQCYYYKVFFTAYHINNSIYMYKMMFMHIKYVIVAKQQQTRQWYLFAYSFS